MNPIPIKRAKTLDQQDLEKLREEQIGGMEVREATVADWLKATGSRNARGEVVLAMRPAPSSWGLLK